MKESLCTGTLFVDPYAGAADKKRLNEYLGAFELAIKPHDGSLQFELSGYDFDDIKSDLVEKVAEYLDMSRKSSLMFFGEDGRICTVIIQDGATQYA